MITAPIEGLVVAITAPPGREVAAGTPLHHAAQLRSSRSSSRRCSRARATREQAAAEFAREERLTNGGRRRAARARGGARGARRGARPKRRRRGWRSKRAASLPTTPARRLEVRAPYRGQVATFDVSIGEGVSSGQRLGMFETARASLVRVELPLPGPSSWSPGAPTIVRRGDGKTWSAKVEGLPASLTAETRRLAYRLRLAADDELPYPGTPLEVRVPIATGIVVPQDAVQQIEGEWGVFVVADERRARSVPIRRGPELGGDVIVLEGLEPGQRIATEGAYLLKALALKRSGGGAEHAH